MLSHRERVIKALRGERADRIPRGEFFIADEFARSFRSEGNAGNGIEFSNHRRVVEQLDLDVASVAFSAGWVTLEQPDQDCALDSLARWRVGSDRFLCALIDGPFSAAVKARGFNELMHYVRGAPRLARELFRRGAEEARVVARAARDAGADGVILGEDIAFRKSTYLAPGDLRELYFPELRAAAHEIRALGLAVFFHSDGNLTAVLDALAVCELDGVQGLEPESGMQISRVRQRVGDALTLWGNLSFDFLSALRTDAEIAVAVRALASSHGAGGKFIFGSCGGLVQGMNLETVRRVYRTLATL